MRTPTPPFSALRASLALLLALGVSGCAGGYDHAASAPSREAYAADGLAMEQESGGYPASAPMAPDYDDSEATEARFEPAPAAQAQYAKAASAPPPPAPPPGPAGSSAAGGQGAPKVASDEARRSPILIYRAEFTMSVFDVQKSVDGVAELAGKHGGYLARRDDRSITVRVPVARFDEVVAALGSLGDVLHRNVSSEDVTAEYRDLEVQLQNLLAMRTRFEKLLEKAQKVEEALQIERELGRVTSEIERIKGRLKLLGDLAAYSTITVRFEPRSTQTVQDGPFVLPLPWLQQLGLPRLLSL